MIERETGRDDHAWSISFFKLSQKVQAFCRNLRIGQDIFDGGELGFGQKSRLRDPVEQAFIEKLLRPNIRSNHPNCLADVLPDRRDEERLGAFDDMRKTNRRFPRSKVREFGSDGRRFYNQSQDFIVAGHAKVLMKLRLLQFLVLQRFSRVSQESTDGLPNRMETYRDTDRLFRNCYRRAD